MWLRTEYYHAHAAGFSCWSGGWQWTFSTVTEPTVETYDLVVRGGTVVDGIADTPYRADVGVTDDRIVAIGDLSTAHAGRVIDARGLRVAPGFIDIHTHSDISVAFHQPMISMISQGVTTQVVGNCSLSLGLARDESGFEFERRWLERHGARIVWHDMDSHLRIVRDSCVATNYVTLAGHGTIRKRVMGMADRPAERHEIEAMKRELVLALEQGAWGLSTGLEYTPSGYANLRELVALSAVMRRFGGLYATHLRNEGDALLEAVQEALTVGEEAGVPVQLSHHKAEHRQNWGKVRQTVQLVERALARGVDVWLDQYPYAAYMTSLSVQVLPPWARNGNNVEILTRLSDEATRRLVAQEMLRLHPEWQDDSPDGPWGVVVIASARAQRHLQGRSIAEIARQEGRPPVEVVLDIIGTNDNFVSAVNHAISEADIEYVLSYPRTLVGSDAVGTAPEGDLAEDQVHPRCYGTFPRVLGWYVRERNVVTEGEAIRKMTSLPAKRLGIRDRGVIRSGAFADLVVYDPQGVRDAATYDRPHRTAEGIHYVVVNGRLVWENGSWTGALPGRVLRRPF